MTVDNAYEKIEKWFGPNHPLQGQMLAMLLDKEVYDEVPEDWNSNEGFHYTNSQGEQAHSWDFEESIGE